MFAQINPADLLHYTEGLPAVASLLRSLPGPGEVTRVCGVPGSLRSLLCASIAGSARRQVLVIAADGTSATHLYDDLALVTTDVKRFETTADRQVRPDHPAVGQIDTIRSMVQGTARVVVTTFASLAQILPDTSSLQRQILLLRIGEEVQFASIVTTITNLGFEKHDVVETFGQYSVRGGIIDVFPFAGEQPLRIEFNGDTIESIREFDLLSQRSIQELTAASIVPNLFSDDTPAPGMERRHSLLDLLAPDALIVTEDRDRLFRAPPGVEKRNTTLSAEEVNERLALFGVIDILSIRSGGPTTIDLGANSQPAFNGSMRSLRAFLVDLQSAGHEVVIMADNQSERKRLEDLLFTSETADGEDAPDVPPVPAGIRFAVHSLHGGFILPDSGLAVITEHQVFGRVKRTRGARGYRFRGISQRELNRLQKGDYVVHQDYGIGRFQGLKRIRIQDVEQEVLNVTYQDDDILFVNLNYVNRIQKYSSKEGHVPKLSKLGRPDWERMKSRAKGRIKDIARDLIRLYAQRKRLEGFAFAPDTPWQKELEATFVYEDTFDQAKTTREVKSDMESPSPMDRLVCGDVGFGKTEVAVRAAFKAVMSGKQVAVLVPTTILALQHYNTFADRIRRYSVNVEVLSRLKSARDQKRILDLAKIGSVDIVIGTHRLLSKDVSFKDLGLLIIDEEHRFGVAAKEKLRQLKTTVDTLTLTATPIPRTLHFSLMGARDLSIIATPPRNRLPVITEIARFSPELIRDAVGREISRGGQVYFVHDRVNDIVEFTARIQELVPGIRVRYAHGQMKARDLEDVVLDFLERKFDVLVCTKIIESGLDIPNVNTILIHRAERFGLAELYQLRGRVGRSNTQAYAYLLTPPVSALPRVTLLRLQALEEFTDLGAGFHLAMRDLEIRGAGNLLGGEQSGFIETMGFETYSRLLEEAVTELREQEFQEVFKDAPTSPQPIETVVDANFDVLIPEDYVARDTERLEIYRRLYGVTSIEQLEELSLELADRFGQMPSPTGNLMGIIRLRIIASRLGFRKVRISSTSLDLDFPPESSQKFYESNEFAHIMSLISTRKKGVALRTQNGGLQLSTSLEPGLSPAATLDYCLGFLKILNTPQLSA